MSLLLDWMIITFLSVYFLLTVVYHIIAKNVAGRNLDVLGLIPKWHFFAPTPGIRNLYLLYRDKYPTGEIGNWTMLHDMDCFRSPWSFIWNPTKRLRKTLFDAIVALVSEDVTNERNRLLVKLSIPYLLILNHVSSIPRNTGALATQFLIMENYADERSNHVFCSDLHSL
jgi:hypothetical protein